jgi:hypothetical protein
MMELGDLQSHDDLMRARPDVEQRAAGWRGENRRHLRRGCHSRSNEVEYDEWVLGEEQPKDGRMQVGTGSIVDMHQGQACRQDPIGPKMQHRTSFLLRNRTRYPYSNVGDGDDAVTPCLVDSIVNGSIGANVSVRGGAHHR